MRSPQSKGGKARAAILSPAQRSEIAKKGAAKRWLRETPRNPDLGVVEGQRVPCPHCGGTGFLDPQRVGIGGRFAIMRRKFDLTQAEMAQKLGVSRAQIGNIETRPDNRPGLDALMKAADVFGCSVDWLLGRADKP